MTAKVFAAAFLCAALVSAAPARADGPPLDAPADVDAASKRAIDRTWLYADDAKVAAPLTVIATTDVSYTHAGASPTRLASPFPSSYDAFAANTAQPGAMVAIGGELGLVPRVSVFVLGDMGVGGEGSSVDAGVMAGLRVSVFPDAWKNVRLVASAGYLREAWSGPVYDDDTGKWLPGSAHGDNGAWARFSFAADVDRFRFALLAHGEHVFSPGRDPVDVMLTAGASARLVGPLRAGVEWVGQDLEETFEAAADGGARHFIGPTVSVQLLRDRVTLAAGPSFGLSDLSPRFVGRLAASASF